MKFLWSCCFNNTRLQFCLFRSTREVIGPVRWCSRTTLPRQWQELWRYNTFSRGTWLLWKALFRLEKLREFFAKFERKAGEVVICRVFRPHFTSLLFLVPPPPVRLSIRLANEQFQPLDPLPVQSHRLWPWKKGSLQRKTSRSFCACNPQRMEPKDSKHMMRPQWWNNFSECSISFESNKAALEIFKASAINFELLLFSQPTDRQPSEHFMAAHVVVVVNLESTRSRTYLCPKMWPRGLDLVQHSLFIFSGRVPNGRK